nr:VTC domain-containing protein [Ruminococcus sp.]
RMDDLDLRVSMDGEPLLPEGYSILEVKVQGAMPLWLSKILNEGRIYKTSFSKYGEAYKRLISIRR